MELGARNDLPYLLKVLNTSKASSLCLSLTICRIGVVWKFTWMPLPVIWGLCRASCPWLHSPALILITFLTLFSYMPKVEPQFSSDFVEHVSSCFKCDAFRANFELILFQSLWFYLTCVFFFNYVVFRANFNLLLPNFFWFCSICVFFFQLCI